MWSKGEWSELDNVGEMMSLPYMQMAALQSPFYEHRLNLYSLTKKIERGDYPPLPSPIFSEKMRRLIDECLQPNQEDRPDVSHVYNVALDMSARQYNVSASYL